MNVSLTQGRPVELFYGLFSHSRASQCDHLYGLVQIFLHTRIRTNSHIAKMYGTEHIATESCPVELIDRN